MTLLSRRVQVPIHWNCASRTVSEIFSIKRWRDLETWGRWFKVIENGVVRYIIYDFLLVGHCKHRYVVPFSSYVSLNNRDLEIWVIYHSRSLKLVPFESLGAVSYSPSIVTISVYLTVYEIFSVKEHRDLENWVRCCSRSLKMTPFDRPHMTFYWSAIVNIALSCIVFQLFDVE